MTLKSRNIYFLVLSIITSIVFIMNISIVLYAHLMHEIIPPENPERLFTMLKNAPFCKYNFNINLASILIFSFFAPLLSFSLLRGFEKTPSLEIFFFSGFIFSCMAESTRIFLPIFGLWKSYSFFIIAIGRTVMTGRFLVPIMFFFITLFTSKSQRQYAERNYFIMVAISIGLGIIYPMNTNITTSSGTVLWGYKNLFFRTLSLLFLVTILSMLVEIYSTGEKLIYVKIISMTIFMTGYSMFCGCDCIMNMMISLPMIVAGCIAYLKTIHKQLNS